MSPSTCERLCDECLELHFKQVEGFGRNKRTEEEWMKFWERNEAWQLKRIQEHCRDKQRV